MYFKNVHPKFPDGGIMSQYLENLPIGGSVMMRGPRGGVTYNGLGNFSIKVYYLYIVVVVFVMCVHLCIVRAFY